ncbi:hypothetical protein KAZ57_03440 [Patescibacteria group bacterium]|nr:hypothetical protein [Patescibacteria group bacterium]
MDDNNLQNQQFDLSYQPQVPVGPETFSIGKATESGQLEIKSQAETVPVETIASEILQNEQLQTTTPPVQQQQPQDDQVIDDPTPPALANQQVVDKTEELTSLHHIQSTKDPLTQVADKEEEEFIEEIEKHHGHQ